MPEPPARLPSAGLRSAGSGPLSPTSSGSYSAAGQAGMGLTSSSTLLPMSRTSSGASALSRGAYRPPSVTGLAGSSSSASAAAASSSGPGSLAAVSRRGARPASGRATTGAAPGVSAAAGPAPAGSLATLDPDLQQRLEAAAAQLGSREWKERLEGLEALQQAVAAPDAAAALTQEAQLWLAAALSQRAVDANLRVQQQVCSAACRMPASLQLAWPASACHLALSCDLPAACLPRCRPWRR